MIEVTGLTRKFGEIAAVEDVSFVVPRGQVVGFLGPNGAGKTTTMRILTTYLAPTTGRAALNGFDVIDRPEAVRRCVGYLPESVPLYPEMRVRSYLQFRARLRDIPSPSRAAAIGQAVEWCGLRDFLDRPIEPLSRGMKQRVGLADALLHRPEILILDEPTAGLDPLQTREVRALVRELAGERTVLLSTHILPEVEAVCSRALVIAGGRLVLDRPLDAPGQGTGLVVEVRAPAEAALRAVATTPGVTSASIQGNDGDWVTIEAESADVREPLVARLIAQGWGVRRLDRRRPSLEADFVRAVQGEATAA